MSLTNYVLAKSITCLYTVITISPLIRPSHSNVAEAMQCMVNASQIQVIRCKHNLQSNRRYTVQGDCTPPPPPLRSSCSMSDGNLRSSGRSYLLYNYRCGGSWVFLSMGHTHAVYLRGSEGMLLEVTLNPIDSHKSIVLYQKQFTLKLPPADYGVLSSCY